MKKSASSCLFTLVAVALAAQSPPAAATDISFESRSYLPASGTKDEGTHVLLYEYLALDAWDLGKTGLYFRVGGWGRADLADETYGEKTNGDLQYAYLGWRAPQANAEGRLGRVSLTAGVARNEVFDGAVFGSDLPYGFDATLYAGIPVETEEGGRSDDLLYGARVSQGHSGLYRIGASYLREENAGDEAREEVGADVNITPHKLVELSGSSLYNLIDDAWAQHDYRLYLGPFTRGLRLTASWVSTDYDSYFQAVSHPAFVQEEAGEKLDRIGGEIELPLGRGFVLVGEYASFSYDIAGSAQSYGARLDWATSGTTAGAGYRQMHGDEDENIYQMFQVHASRNFGPLLAAAEFQYLAYEEEINGEDSGTTAMLSLSYSASRALELTASAEYGVTPEFEREVSGMLAMTWRYDASTKKGGSK